MAAQVPFSGCQALTDVLVLTDVSVEATLTSASFHATLDATGSLSYRVKADFAANDDKPRIGLRGTAQVHGEKVLLAYYLFRKPLSAIRQWTGL